MATLSLGTSGSLAVTSAAEDFMRRMIRFAGLGPHAGFRLVVSPGGCAGLSSDFTVETAPRPDDLPLALSGMRLFLPVASLDLLSSVTIDFVDTPTQAGLIFIDPKQATCASEPRTAMLVTLDKPGP